MVTRIGPKRLRRRLYIDEWMAERNLSDEKLGQRLGVARQTVFRWRREQWRLDTEKQILLAEALGIEPEELWRPPSRPSLDAIVKNAPEELQATAADIVRRLVGKAS